MATITLSDIVFTPRRDVVDGFGSGQNLLVAAGLPVDTLTGSDALYGRASSSADSFLGGLDRLGIYLQADLRTGPDQSSSLFRFLPGFDDDLVVGEAANIEPTADEVIFVYGITIGFNDNPNLVLSTGLGSDRIEGTANFVSTGQYVSDFVYGIQLVNNATINSGGGADGIIGEASGDGNERIIGIRASNFGAIFTGDGCDKVTGIATNQSGLGFTAGIDGVMTIDTGAHADVVTAKATVNGQRVNGFGNGVAVDLGSGFDKLVGFGGVTANGGTGIDTWDLRGYQSSDFTITKTGGATKAATFEGFGATASIQNFEVFLFDNGLFTYNSLPIA